jgi:Spy/CpxP family protein refolding chaperone
MIDELAKEQNAKLAMVWQSYNKLAEKIRGLLTAEQKKAMEAPYKVPQGLSPGGAQGASDRPLAVVSDRPLAGGMGRSLVYRINEAGVGGKSAAQWYIESIDKIVNLTDAQKKAVTETIEARDKAMREFQTKNAEKLKAASAAMMEAFKSKDKDAIAKSQKAYQEIYAPMHEAMKKSQGELDNILTPQQKEKLQESRMTSWIKALTDPAQLTDEQMKKLKAAYAELTKATGHEGMERKLPETVQNILTAEQKATIAKHRAMMYVKAMFARAKLTDEQMKRVEAMADELAKDQKAKLGLDWQVYNKLAEKIRELLTAEQKEAIRAPTRLGAPGASATPLPGRVQVILSESGQNREVLEGRCKELSKMAGRIEHEAHELHEALERMARQPEQCQVQILPGQPAPGRPDPAIEDLRRQVQELRRQVQDLKTAVEKAGAKK